MNTVSQSILKQVSVPQGVLTYATIEQARTAGASDRDIAAALAAQCADQVAIIASALRAQVVSTDPAKLQEYGIKEHIALDPTNNASAPERALLTAEAKARGLKFEELIGLITSRAGDLRLVALSIAAWEAKARAALVAFDPSGNDPLAALDIILNQNEASAKALMAKT